MNGSSHLQSASQTLTYSDSRALTAIALLISILIVSVICSGCHPKIEAQVEKTKNPASRVSVDPTRELDLKEGKKLYERYCSTCHGDGGAGDGFNSFNLNPKPRNFTDPEEMGRLTDDLIVLAIKRGGRGVGRSPAMPSWGNTLNDQEIARLILYIRSFMQPKSEEPKAEDEGAEGTHSQVIG